MVGFVEVFMNAFVRLSPAKGISNEGGRVDCGELLAVNVDANTRNTFLWRRKYK